MKQTEMSQKDKTAFAENLRIVDALKINALFFTLDEEFTILGVSKCFYEKTGYSKIEFDERFHTISQYYENHFEDFITIKNSVLKAIEDNQSEVCLTVSFPKKDGDTLCRQLSITIDKHYGDTIILCCATYKSIVQQDLPFAGGEYFKWLMDEYKGNVYVTDMDNYKMLFLNQFGCETLGISRKKALENKCYEITQGRTSPCPFCEKTCNNDNSFTEWEYYNPMIEQTFIIKKRDIQWGGHTYRIVISRDNNSSEHKLEIKNRERDAIIRTIPGGFARVDATDMRTILWYAGGFLDMIGYTKEQFENELHNQGTYVHPDDIEHAASVMLKSKDSGEDTIVEGRIVTRDGTIKILTMTYSYVAAQDSWDGIASFYSVGIDVTKEREAMAKQQEILEDAYQTAKIASLAKTDFLSSMSHNIRTPMNAIMGMAAIAKANLNSTEKVSDCLNKIENASNHLLTLINEVLDMSKIEHGKIDLALAETNLDDLLEELSEICQPLIEEKHLYFEIDTSKVIHKHILVDKERLKQVLMNLLSNAIKYTSEGSITLKINELSKTVYGRRQYEFICIDTGIGISKDFLPFLFEPFARAEDPRISKHQGTGLGMTIIDNIVHLMQGTIKVESEVGIGSRFTITLPFTLCEDLTVQNKKDEQPILQESNFSIDGKNILLVEDNELNLEIALEFLKMLNVNVTAVENGKQAVDEFTSSLPGTYHAILMDIQMPIMNGYEATTTIRSLHRKDAKTIPIIALTADAFATDMAKTRNVGMNDHIAKPIDIQHLLEVLKKWMK